MYHPYFRGKQNELIVIRENAELMAQANFVPIIEPVKAATNGLVRALKAIADANGSAVLIANPAFGDFKERPGELERLLFTELKDVPGISVGVRIATPESNLGDISAKRNLDDISALCTKHAQRPITILHCGYPDGKRVVAALSNCGGIARHIFLDESCGKLYQNRFRNSPRVLVRDGFKRRTNREYPDVEPFSELHVTYPSEGMNGFGDFLIVGDDYQEAGGPAYAVAIHLTYIDSEQDDVMFVLHFVSDTTNTPQDPAGKFAEALTKLVAEVQCGKRSIRSTKALAEFLEIHRQQHFPGLGVVKKLSMQHHIETLVDHFQRAPDFEER